MKILYTLADGTLTEVEVSKEVASALHELQQEEWRIERTERRHTVSLDSLLYEGTPLGTLEDLCDPYIREDLIDEMEAVLDELTELQRNRFIMWANGLTCREIADIEGIDFCNVDRSIQKAQQKLKKIF